MGFQPGHKGYRTKESYQKAAPKVSAALRGKPKWSPEQRQKIGERQKGRVPWNKGKTSCFSPDVVERISRAAKARGITPEHRARMVEGIRRNPGKPWLGKRFSEEHKSKIGRSGSAHPNWIPDRSKVKLRRDVSHPGRLYEWAKLVKIRDGGVCQLADQACSTYLEAHHILPYRSHPELRYVIENGITLCRAHHPHGEAAERRLSPALQQIVQSKLQ